MSRDGELTSHLPLMKAPTPVMLLVGEPWECRDDSEEVFGVTDSDDRGCRFLWGTKKLVENERIRATAPERCPHVGLDSEGAQRGRKLL